MVNFLGWRPGYDALMEGPLPSAPIRFDALDEAADNHRLHLGTLSGFMHTDQIQINGCTRPTCILAKGLVIP
jgi:hypothetical protein